MGRTFQEVPGGIAVHVVAVEFGSSLTFQVRFGSVSIHFLHQKSLKTGF